MYTSVKNIQIIISLLKQYGVKKLVLSPGTRNAAFVKSVEDDKFFECYSFVDERSAGFFAIGLSIASREPVCLSCTSSTATCNYTPAIVAAKKMSLPIVVLTADRDYRNLYQMEDQQINQIDMYNSYTSFAVNLPTVKDRLDVYYCERRVNEALLHAKWHSKPVQINFEVTNTSLAFTIKKLPKYRKIDFFDEKSNQMELLDRLSLIKNKKKILVICGMNPLPSKRLSLLLDEFSEKFGAVISVDNLSNVYSKNAIRTTLITESINLRSFKQLSPDLVITIGGHIWSFIKQKLRSIAGTFEHWEVSPRGTISDGFYSLTCVFNMTATDFFSKICELPTQPCDHSYINLWRQKVSLACQTNLPFCNFYAIKKLISKLPDNSMLHTSILNSTRLSNFIKHDKKIAAFGNLGADGIDGTLSTFIGQSESNSNALCFLIIGDLSFIYDLNAAEYILKPNQRIFLINNFVGSEFYNNFGINNIPSLPNFIAAGHNSKIASCRRDIKAKYLNASNAEELDSALNIFVTTEEIPMILEVFTNPEIDSSELMKYYRENSFYSKKVIFIKNFYNFIFRDLSVRVKNFLKGLKK